MRRASCASPRRDYLRQLGPYMADHSAVFASGGIKDALGPLQIERDVVIAARPWIVRRPLRCCSRHSWLQGRRVFLLPNVMPREKMNEVLEGRKDWIAWPAHTSNRSRSRVKREAFLVRFFARFDLSSDGETGCH